MQLDDAALQQGFSFAPGRLFSASDRYRNCLRFSCDHPWSERTEQAIVKLGELVRAAEG
jgi:DNA-binding transcriptional MocR family regulator